MRRRWIPLLAVLLSCLLLCGCMTKKERRQALRNEKKAGPMITAYLQQHYGGGQVGTLTCLDQYKSGGPIPDPFTRASDWVEAPVRAADGRSFTVLVNVPGRLLLDDARRDLLQQSFVERSAKALGTRPSGGVELYYRYADTSGPDSDTFLGFCEPEIRTAQQLMASGNYRVKVAMKCGYGQLALDEIDLSGFFPTGTHRDLQAVVALYRQEYSMAAPLLSDWGYAADEQQRAYWLEGLYSATYRGRYDSDTGVTQPVSRPEIDCLRYARVQIAGMELAWDAGQAELQLREQPAPAEVTADLYGGAVWDATGDTVTVIDCPELDGLDGEVPRVAVYCYFSPEDLGREVLVTSRQSGGATSGDSWRVEMENGLCCRTLYLTAGSTTIGFYEPRQDPLESGESSAPEDPGTQGETQSGGTCLEPAA